MLLYLSVCLLNFKKFNFRQKPKHILLYSEMEGVCRIYIYRLIDIIFRSRFVDQRSTGPIIN